MKKITFHIAKMDCPSDATLIEMKLKSLPSVRQIETDLTNRHLRVYLDDDSQAVFSLLGDMNLQASLLSETEIRDVSIQAQSQERTALKLVLLINFLFFLFELTAGILGDSMGLIADSLDMLADALVYGLALYAVGGAIERKKQVACVAGVLQVLLAIIGFWEVIRRFFGAESEPHVSTMLMVASLALIANATCVWLLQKAKSKEAHIQASLIFTSYDVIANLGVMLAAGLVYFFHSPLPDLIVGALIFILVIEGAVRIFKLAR